MSQSERLGTSNRPPTIMLTTTFCLDKTARLAIALADMGCKIALLCPSGDLTRFTERVWRRRNYHALAPLRSLDMAIKDLQPDLIIPCDDRTVEHLHRLFQENS